MYEYDLQKMSRHLVNILDQNREVIVTEDHELVFKAVEYGEPRAILEWPLLSVQPIGKEREIKTTRKYGIRFEIAILLYHGEISKASKIQESTHKRAEALERFILSDRKWNFVSDDSADDKVIHGHVTLMDHPIVVAGNENMWMATRLQLDAISEEVF